MTLEPLLTASPVIQLHAYAAMLAFLVGGVIFYGAKGDGRHRLLGRIWVGLMALTALSSLFIWTFRMFGLFSPVHLLSLLTLAGLFGAIRYARLKQIAAHKRVMEMTYTGALIIAGFFTFMPGRIMHEVVFGNTGGNPMIWAVFVLLYAGFLFIGYVGLRRRMGWKLPLPGRF